VTVGKRSTVYKVNDQPSCVLLTAAAGGYLLLYNGKFSDCCGQERRKLRQLRSYSREAHKSHTNIKEHIPFLEANSSLATKLKYCLYRTEILFTAT